MIYKCALMLALILAGGCGCGGGRLAASDLLLEKDDCGKGKHKHNGECVKN